MKIKLLTLTAIVAGILAIASTANAATCEGGTLATGENGHEYCQSNNYMNWWSAYTWCEANGRHMASIYEICPEWDGSTGEYKCANYNGNFSYCWTSTAASQGDKAFYVYAGGRYKSIGEANRNSAYDQHALCY